MKIFTPPELKDQISEAISTLTKITRQNINDFGDEISEIISDDLTSDKDDEYITNETELYVWLPQSEFCERSIVRNCGDFIQLVNELKTAQLIDDKYCQTEKRVLVQVNFSNLKSEKTINNSLPDTYLNSTEELQKKVFRLLGYNDKDIDAQFGHMLEAFQYGAPPHGGIALGLDRIVMLLAGEATIREVIAFPKNQNAADLTFNAPSPVSEEQLTELQLRLREE